ncbi:hypothetical protein LTR36_010344 [Oleoguttula mirabilis]|uniref:Fungal N-terminal domain-containing protein n=1 Tax=Oleoguttula mirabilis TaxID=1507867 RepID=A0AAV9J4E6_9PEZI|nr:hypothetical protein LTR36_010344 [Oleoguttula mirabilis]
MALQPLSIGDILMLSQTAWKIGRAFTQGKKSAPSEFNEVEREANGLSEALKLVAETLHTDGSILSQAEPETRVAVSVILESARKTLSDLESFVERYQVIKKRVTNGGGFVVERSWSEVVMANYKTFQWTTEGGDISELRNMLQMHTNTINLVMQALQSRSLARLEKTVMPMADYVANIHNRVTGDLGGKIDDLHRIIMAVANSTPALQARDRAMHDANSLRTSSSSTVHTLKPSRLEIRDALHTKEAHSQNSSSHDRPVRSFDRKGSQQSSHSTEAGAARPGREDSAYYSGTAVSPWEPDGRRMDWISESGSPPARRGTIGEETRSDTSSLYSCPSTPERRPELNVMRRESVTLPTLFSAVDEAIAENVSNRDAYYSDVSPTAKTPASAAFPTDSMRRPDSMPSLPPPAIPYRSDSRTPATPSTYFGASRGSRSDTEDYLQPQTPKSIKQGRAANGHSQSPNTPLDDLAFDKQLFRNSAILCDVRATSLEYAHHITDALDPRFDTEMVEACKESRVCVIRKRENRTHGGTKIVTSIWTISDDGEVRCQQKLSDLNETVPYCSYFDPLKVSLPPTEGAISLEFHAEMWGEMLKDEKKTKWVNYVFASDGDAVAFQSAVFGRTLIGSYRTTKTTVIHDGLKGAFAFEEQFANIEMLRLWEDDGTSTVGAAGGVMALMHISSNFGEGWARWWINSSKQQVRVREDGGKYAKVKGVDIMVVKPGNGASAAEKSRSASAAGLQRAGTDLEVGRLQGGSRTQVKRVTGVRIEFKTEEERAGFVNASKRVQERMLALPDL